MCVPCLRAPVPSSLVRLPSLLPSFFVSKNATAVAVAKEERDAFTWAAIFPGFRVEFNDADGVLVAGFPWEWKKSVDAGG